MDTLYIKIINCNYPIVRCFPLHNMILSRVSKSAMYTVFEAVRPHFNALAKVGYYKILVPVKRKTLILHNIYRGLIWSMVFVYNLQHIIRAFQSLQFTEQLVNTLFILLTTLNTLGKQIAFNSRQRRVHNIITMWNDNTSFTPSAHHEAVIKRDAALMSRILNLYLFAVYFCGILWTVFPIMNKALGEKVQLTAYFPYDTSSSPTFEITVVFMGVLITIQGSGNVTMDCIIVAFYSQAQTQFRILRHNLEHLTDIHKSVSRIDNELKRTIHTRLIKCVKHYKRIVWFVKEVESIFGEAMIVQFIVMAWVICMTLYKIVGLDIISMEYISMVTYLVCMAAQLFIYCYWGTQLKYESELIINTTYNMDWLVLTPALRRQLIIFMECSKRPVEPRTAYIIPHSLGTYITVLRSSYALFTFLTKK